MKAVHFGAGNIGRGFIGLMLSRSGYNVCFVARNEKQISLLQNKRQYTVKVANEAGDIEIVKNVTAVHVNNSSLVEEKIADADLITTAVGAPALKQIAKAIAGGIKWRLKTNPRRLQIIACENTVRSSSQLKRWVYFYLHSDWHGLADRLISFPDTIVDRIVPHQKHEDPLLVKVEPFYEWVIHRSAPLMGLKKINGVQYVDALEPYMERKLFTVNTGHCCAAYFGYLKGYQTIQEAMNDPWLRRRVRRVLQETGAVLVKKHGLEERSQQEYIHKTLERFANPELADKVVRVGRSPIRKLSRNDRLVRPLMEAFEMRTDTSHLVSAIAAALLFDHENDPEAAELQTFLRSKGIRHVICHYMGIAEEHPVHPQIANKYEEYYRKYRAGDISRDVSTKNNLGG